MRVLIVGATGTNARLVVPESLNRGVVAMLGEVLRRPIAAEGMPFQQWAWRLPEGPQRDGLTRMMSQCDEHGPAGGNALVLRAIPGREPRTLIDFFRELATRQ